MAILELAGVSKHFGAIQALIDVSLTLHEGEILGIGGLAGQGQRELFMTLFGARKASGGEVVVGGRPC